MSNYRLNLEDAYDILEALEEEFEESEAIVTELQAARSALEAVEFLVDTSLADGEFIVSEV